MSFEQGFNLVEGIVWISIAIYLLTRVSHFPDQKDILFVGFVAFFLFGITDFIEIFTGSWYEPIWLLLLNGVCIITLIACLLLYWRRNKRAQHTSDGNAEKPPGVDREP